LCFSSFLFFFVHCVSHLTATDREITTGNFITQVGAIIEWLLRVQLQKREILYIFIFYKNINVHVECGNLRNMHDSNIVPQGIQTQNFAAEFSLMLPAQVFCVQSKIAHSH
jgi:hypothetical protein